MMSLKTKTLQTDQQGFASLVIAIVLVLVLSLMTVGFAQLMRNEERSALDKHLSNQAYYAAETGINDAAKAINAGFGSKGEAKNDCKAYDNSVLGNPPYVSASTDPRRFLVNSTVGNDPGITYTCLLIDPFVDSLEYADVGDVNPEYVYLTGVNSADHSDIRQIDKLLISWQDTNTNRSAHNFASNSHKFDPNVPGGWEGKTGVLKVGLTPLDSGNINRDYLIQNTYMAFFYPNGGAAVDMTSTPPGGSVSSDNYDSHTNLDAAGRRKAGGIVNGNCNITSQPKDCNVIVTNIGHSNILLDLESIYTDSRVSVVAYDSDGNVLDIKNAQTLVDSTGKAQDVLKRVQVRIPNKNHYSMAPGLQVGGSICKQYELKASGGSNQCP